MHLVTVQIHSKDIVVMVKRESLCETKREQIPAPVLTELESSHMQMNQTRKKRSFLLCSIALLIIKRSLKGRCGLPTPTFKQVYQRYLSLDLNSWHFQSTNKLVLKRILL